MKRYSIKVTDRVYRIIYRIDGMLYFGRLWCSHQRWFLRYPHYRGGKTSRVIVRYQGFGINGPIISMMDTCRCWVGEMITSGCTGSTAIWVHGIKGKYLHLFWESQPAATRIQAGLILASKLIASQKEAMK